MATLHIFGKTDTLDIPIVTLSDLRRHIPEQPENPSLYRLDSDDMHRSVTITYGSPDAEQAEIKDFDGDRIGIVAVNSFDTGTATFIATCSSMFS